MSNNFILSNDIKEVIKKAKENANNNDINEFMVLSAFIELHNEYKKAMEYSCYNGEKLIEYIDKRKLSKSKTSSGMTDKVQFVFFNLRKKEGLVKKEHFFKELMKLKSMVELMNENIIENVEEIFDNLNEINNNNFAYNFSEDKESNYLIDLEKEIDKSEKIIGRDQEINDIFQILKRKKKRNPLIIGDNGVGKTKLAEEIALRIANKTAPTYLHGKKVYQLNTNYLMANTSLHGQLEQKVNEALKEIKELNGSAIIFIDNLDLLMGGKDNNQRVSISELLKPELERNKFTCISIVSSDNYRYIESDKSFKNCFQAIKLKEPSKKETFEILKGLKYVYENYNDIKIDDDALKEIVTLTDRYITERCFPEKAFDVLDEASAYASRTLAYEPLTLIKLKKELKEEIEKNNDLKVKEIESEIKKINDVYKNELIEYKKGNVDFNYEIISPKVTVKEILKIVAKKSGVPVDKLNKSNKEKVLALKDQLKAGIIGQSKAIDSVCKAIKRSTANISDPEKPLGSFLFLGSSGVGKTEVSKQLALQLFGSKKDLIRFDMSEYMEKSSVSNFIGSSRGYIGSDSGGLLTNAVKNNPYSIVLLDEIEKAHPDVLNILLQVLDEGHLTDSLGVKVNFKNTIIIMTSNIGSEHINKQSFWNTNTENKVLKDLKKHLRAELINRIDETVIFNSLSKNDLKEITVLNLKAVSERLKNQKIYVDFDQSCVDFIINDNFDVSYGARPLKRKIQDSIEDVISDWILMDVLMENDKALISYTGGEFICDKLN